MDAAPGATLELDYRTVDPATAYAKLRTYTPGRASFLLQSLAPDDAAGRYSVVGYRVQTGEALPPGMDAIATQTESVGSLAPLPSLAQGLAQGLFGYFTYANVHTRLGLRHWPDEALAASFMRQAVVMLFDHHEERVVVAAPRPGKLAERCAWELEHGPAVEPAPPAVDESALPSYQAFPDAAGLAARALRARRFLSDPAAPLVLAQRLVVPGAGVDPWDAYRALCRLRPSSHGFFLDVGQTPLAAERWVFGTSSTVLACQRRDDGEPASAARLQEALGAAFPHPTMTGGDPPEAAQIIRRLEEQSRGELGAAVGYVCPGSEACFVLAEAPIGFEGHAFEVPVPVTTGPDVAPDAAVMEQQVAEVAGPSLAAIAAAQQAAARRA